MVDEVAIANEYLMPTGGAFWRWSDHGEVIVWTNGKVIAFRPELVVVLERLAANGLPPLDMVLLVLAAMRDSWPQDLTRPARMKIRREPDKAEEVMAEYQELMQELSRVHNLPTDLRCSPEGKALVCEAALAGIGDRLSASHSRIVCDHLRVMWPELSEDAVYSDNVSRDGFPYEDYHRLTRSLRRTDVAQLRLRWKTGLDDLPEPARVDLTLRQRVRCLLEQLRGDSELSGLAALARNLMAAVSMPRAITQPDQLQVGGISDISNRGPLDRLLLTELAQDDFALVARVAMNEALYLRRESPPCRAPRSRAVLLESGIRSWGVPRVYATAVALALAATVEPEVELRVFRARGEFAQPLELTRRAGIIEHLGELDSSLHPGRALAAFERTAAGKETSFEPILVTTEEVLRDADFQRYWINRRTERWYVATVRRDGAFRLAEYSAQGVRQLREAQLELGGTLLRPDRPQPSRRERRGPRELPLVFDVSPFPLLLPHRFDVSHIWQVREVGVFAIARGDRRLMWWQRPGRGAWQIATAVTSGHILWTSTGWDGFPIQAAVAAGRDAAPTEGIKLLTVDCDHYRCKEESVKLDRDPVGACAAGPFLLALAPPEVTVIERETARVVQRLVVPNRMKWERDRFFRCGETKRWYALGHDGTRVHLDEVSGVEQESWPELVTLFDSAGRDGPMGVTAEGDLFSTATGERIRLEHGLPLPVRLHSALSDGSEIFLVSSSTPVYSTHKGVCVHVETRTIRPFSLVGDARFAPLSFLYCRPVSLRSDFDTVYRDAGGRLGLRSQGGESLVIDYDDSSGQMVLRPSDDPEVRHAECEFHQGTLQPFGFGLFPATWEDGNRVWLDSRGLLHLVSSDRRIPEVTMVLTERELAGWCSDGRFWGSEFFVGDHPTVPAREVFEQVIVPFVRNLP